MTSNPDTVSVIIACFNARAFLARALESVRQQTRPADEVIVIDDGSTDESVQIARSFGPWVTVVEQPNRGACRARNEGLRRARGRRSSFSITTMPYRPRPLLQGLVAGAANQLWNGRGREFLNYLRLALKIRPGLSVDMLGWPRLFAARLRATWVHRPRPINSVPSVRGGDR